MVYRAQLNQVSLVGLGPLAHGVGSVGASVLGAVKKIAGMTVKHCGAVPPLPSNDLIALQKQLTHQKTLTRILKRTFQIGYTQKQATRKQVAAWVLDTAAKLGGYKISTAEKLTNLVKASVGQALSTAENKYLEKFCTKVMQPSVQVKFSALRADYAWLRADVRAVFDGFLAEYPPEQEIGSLSIDCIINAEQFDQDVLTPENQSLKDRLGNDLLNRVAKFKEKYGEEALQKFVRQEVSALSTLGSAQFDLALKHLVVKGPEWVRSDFLPQRDALMQDVKNVLAGFPQRFQQAPYLPVSTLTPAGLSSWLQEQLSLGKTEPWSQMPDYVDHLLAQPCLEALSTELMTAFATSYSNLRLEKQVVKLHTENFVSNPFGFMAEEQKKGKINEIHQQVFEQNQDIEEGLLKHLIGAAIETKPYQLETEKNKDGPGLVTVSGYFKKTLNADLKATRVRTASGKVYELLNTLSPEASQALHKQQGLNRRGKVVLGAGGYGKVRLARELGTDNIVVVKKFAKVFDGRVRDPRKDANDELDKVGLVQRLAALKGEAVSNTLASVLDYAHVKVPSRGSNRLVDKSYVFMPLLNGGDGNAAVRSLLHMRQNDPVNADVRFLHIAKGYAESVKNLHALGLHHRDIKLSNFMHTWVKDDESGQQVERLTLIDFGAVQLSKNKHEKRIDGTYVYCPPEKFPQTEKKNDPNYYADKHDAFSLGVSLLELRLGRFLPYTEGSAEPESQAFTLKLKDKNGVEEQFILPLDVADYDQSGRWWRPLGIPTKLLKNFADDHIDNIIAKLLAKNPKKRMSAAEAFEALQNLEVRPVDKTMPLNDGAGPSGQKTMRLADYLGLDIDG